MWWKFYDGRMMVFSNGASRSKWVMFFSLSYARAENEPLARELYQRLSAAGLAVWWDRVCMPARSLTFLQEIRLAVRDAERTVVIVDGPACQSEYVRAEWQYALAAGARDSGLTINHV